VDIIQVIGNFKLKNKYKNMITKALIVVDPQNDFCPGGSLAVKDGDQIVPIINKLTKSDFFDLVIFTKDWHPFNMKAFASQHKGKNPFETYINDQEKTDILWPDHCVQDTEGAMFHKNIDMNIPNLYIFKKGLEVDSHPYSGFGDLDNEDSSGLLEFLVERGVNETYICGLALDFCVRDTAIDSVLEGFATHVIMDGVKAIAEDLTPTLDKFKEKGIMIIYSNSILKNDENE
jgi:nicotinamidase/pyrazinamidase